jgi:hypothetical protein
MKSFSFISVIFHRSIECDVNSTMFTNIDLNRRIKLSDGSFEKILTYHQEENNKTFFSCFVCRVGNLPGEELLKTHLKGKRHLKNIKKVPNAALYRVPLSPSEDSK